jgi:hypothetical protein
MRRRLVSGAGLLAAVSLFMLIGAGCDKPSTPTPVQPSPQAVTETFSGTLTVNGAITFPFAAEQAGALTGTLTAVGPESSVIGIALGTYAGTTCEVRLANDQAGLSAVITGVVNASGLLCARVYDATGKLVAPVTFTLTVAHF